MFITLILACSHHIPVQTLDVEPQPLQVPLAQADAEQGRHLVHAVAVCTECHGADLAGKEMISGFPMGTLVAPNLTTLAYTQDQWLLAIRHGLDAQGTKLLMMPSDDYAGFDQHDLADMIAYLQGLPAVERDFDESRLGPVGNMLVKKGEWSFAADRIDHAAAVPLETQVDRGEYLAQVSACLSCHGGGPGKGFGPGQPMSSNLTPHADGLADWSRDDFARALRQGVRPDGQTLDPMMPWPAYAALPDSDVDALWAFLQTLEPQPDPVE